MILLYVIFGLASTAALLILLLKNPYPWWNTRVHRRPRSWSRTEIAMEISRVFHHHTPRHHARREAA